MRIRTRHGEVNIQVFGSHTDCGLTEMGCITWPRNASVYAHKDKRMEVYEDVLKTLRRGIKGYGSWGMQWCGQIILSDPREYLRNNNFSLYEMMHVGAAALWEKGELSYVEGPATYNPNSGNHIACWLIQTDGGRYKDKGIPDCLYNPKTFDEDIERVVREGL